MSATPQTYIEAIELEDWRQYKGTQRFDLGPDPRRHINAIIGENGTGKTNLAKAVTTCLNGSVPGESGDDEEEPHINSEIFESVEDGKAASGSIRLYLTHQGTEYVIEREFVSRKKDGTCTNGIDSSLTVERHVPHGGWEEVESPSKLLTQILPPEVQRYYFFDGERLDALFQKGNYEDDVRSAVWELSHVEVLEEAIDHLDTLRDERRRQANSSSGEVEDVREQRDEKEAERADLIDEIDAVERSINEKEGAVSEIEDRMGAASNPEVLDLIESRARLETAIGGLLDMEDELDEELDRLLIEAGSIRLAGNALDLAAEKFDEMGARDELPPAVRRKYLTGLLDEETCLCGCDLQKNPIHRQNVENLRDSTPEVSDRLIEASYEFPDTRATGEQYFGDLRATKRDLRETTRDRLQKEGQAEELTENLRGHDVPEGIDLKSLDEEREQLRAELRGLGRQKGRLEEQLETVNNKIESLNQRIEREIQKDEHSKELMREVEWYRRASERLEAIKNELMTEILEAIEASLDQYYNRLTWKDEDYDLTVKEDFGIRIMGPEGRRKVDRLSAGETAILALSFIAAMTEVSGFDAPVLIDTPLGRIDQEHRSAIARKLPQYLVDHQVTFLFTDSEFDETVSSTLEPHIANRYKLANDNRVTNVRVY